MTPYKERLTVFSLPSHLFTGLRSKKTRRKQRSCKINTRLFLVSFTALEQHSFHDCHVFNSEQNLRNEKGFHEQKYRQGAFLSRKPTCSSVPSPTPGLSRRGDTVICSLAFRLFTSWRSKLTSSSL